MKKFMTLAAIGMLIAGIGASAAVNAEETASGTTAAAKTLKNGAAQGAKDGLKNGLKDGLKKGLKNGLKKGQINGAKK